MMVGILWILVWRLLKRIKTELQPCNPAIPFLGICPKEYKSAYTRDTCTPKFIVAQFTIVKCWSQWIMNKENAVYPHTEILFSHKKSKIISFAGKGRALEIIMLNEATLKKTNITGHCDSCL
jgi:hypothetical protein